MSDCMVQGARLRAAERRRVVEDAAAELFASRGYAATTISDIASHAGVTKPIIYRHFESKQHLVVVLLERHRDELAAAPLDAILASSGQPLARRIDTMLEAWFTYAEQHPFVRVLLQRDDADSAVAAVVSELHERQRLADIALLREFAPHIPEQELPALGELVRASLAGLALWRHDNDKPMQEAIAAMRRMLLGIIGPHERQPGL